VIVTHKIDDNYIRCDDRNVYRLPKIMNGKEYVLKKVKKQKGFIYLYSKKVKINDIVFIEIEPYEIKNILI
jgi:hypothetical protein